MYKTYILCCRGNRFQKSIADQTHANAVFSIGFWAAISTPYPPSAPRYGWTGNLILGTFLVKTPILRGFVKSFGWLPPHSPHPPSDSPSLRAERAESTEMYPMREEKNPGVDPLVLSAEDRNPLGIDKDRRRCRRRPIGVSLSCCTMTLRLFTLTTTAFRHLCGGF